MSNNGAVMKKPASKLDYFDIAGLLITGLIVGAWANVLIALVGLWLS